MLLLHEYYTSRNQILCPFGPGPPRSLQHQEHENGDGVQAEWPANLKWLRISPQKNWRQITIENEPTRSLYMISRAHTHIYNNAIRAKVLLSNNEGGKLNLNKRHRGKLNMVSCFVGQDALYHFKRKKHFTSRSSQNYLLLHNLHNLH